MRRRILARSISISVTALFLSSAVPVALNLSHAGEYEISEDVLKEVMCSHTVSLSRLTREAERNLQRVNEKLEELKTEKIDAPKQQ